MGRKQRDPVSTAFKRQAEGDDWARNCYQTGSTQVPVQPSPDPKTLGGGAEEGASTAWGCTHPLCRPPGSAVPGCQATTHASDTRKPRQVRNTGTRGAGRADDYQAWGIQKTELCKPEEACHPPTVKFGNSTTFQDDYIPKEINPMQSFKPPFVFKCSKVPFSGDTSHRIDYVPHHLESKFARPKEAYKSSNQPFEVLTTHRSDFQGLDGEAAKICKPAYNRVTQSAHFEGSTEFRESFQPEIPPPVVKKVPEYVPPPGSMQLNSTSHLDYVPHQAKRTVPIWPISQRRNNNFPFQGESTTKEDFPVKICRQGIVKRQHQIPRPSGKFDVSSTFRALYVPHELIPTESCKPLNVALTCSIPFDDVTMYSIEYTPKKQEVCPTSYPSPPGYIFENTNYQGHTFYRKIIPPVKAIYSSNHALKKLTSKMLAFQGKSMFILGKKN
ncbi:LOW QUALITY PROTEIN: stabilizer of axonemal microtubules 2 [Rhynchocyon petersi]